MEYLIENYLKANNLPTDNKTVEFLVKRYEQDYEYLDEIPKLLVNKVKAETELKFLKEVMGDTDGYIAFMSLGNILIRLPWEPRIPYLRENYTTEELNDSSYMKRKLPDSLAFAGFMNLWKHIAQDVY